MYLNIKSDKLVDITLGLQRINDVALPFAVQNTLNAVARDIKKRTLISTTQSMFDIQKRTFFKANSGYKQHKAKEFGYNINRMVATAGITKSSKPNEKATEQVAHQQTGQNIDRQINPLNNKPLRKNVIDILQKKPEVYDSSKTYPEGNSIAYIRKAQRAHRTNRGLLVKNGSGRGALNRVKSIKKVTSKKNPYKMQINTVAIASFIQGGKVKLTDKHPFMLVAAEKSMSSMMNNEFIKQAKYQFSRAMKK